MTSSGRLSPMTIPWECTKIVCSTNRNTIITSVIRTRLIQLRTPRATRDFNRVINMVRVRGVRVRNMVRISANVIGSDSVVAGNAIASVFLKDDHSHRSRNRMHIV